MISSLLRAVVVLVTVAGLSIEARAQYSDCGVLEQGVTCVLFRDSQNQLWSLQDYGSFQVGDQVFVTGIPVPGCISICQQGNGCIDQNTIGPCDPTTSFCFCGTGAPCGNSDPNAGCANSTGVGAQLAGSGTASVGSDDLILTARQLPANVSGLVFMGAQQISTPFGDGLRCVGGGTFRFPLRNAGTGGTFDEGPIVSWANTHFGPMGTITAGSTWLFQTWYRNASGPCGQFTNMSNAVSATFTP